MLALPLPPPSCSRAWAGIPRSAASAGPAHAQGPQRPTRVPFAPSPRSPALGEPRARVDGVSPPSVGGNHLSPQQHNVQRPGRSLFRGWFRGCFAGSRGQFPPEEAGRRAPREPSRPPTPSSLLMKQKEGGGWASVCPPGCWLLFLLPWAPGDPLVSSERTMSHFPTRDASLMSSLSQAQVACAL